MAVFDSGDLHSDSFQNIRVDMAGTRQCIDSASASLTLSINLSDYRDLEVVVSYH